MSRTIKLACSSEDLRKRGEGNRIMQSLRSDDMEKDCKQRKKRLMRVLEQTYSKLSLSLVPNLFFFFVACKRLFKERRPVASL